MFHLVWHHDFSLIEELEIIMINGFMSHHCYLSFRNAVGDLNNKYKQCLIMCKQLSTQEELLTHDEMKGVTLTADKLLYLHAIDLCLNAASLEFFGKAQEVRKSNDYLPIQ